MDAIKADQLSRYLVVRIHAGCRAAIPLQNVVEICRPLPIEPLSETPAFVKGVSLIRAIPTPVINLALVLGLATDVDATRLVILRTGDRSVAVAVTSVVGVAELSSEDLQQSPPLLGLAPGDVLDCIGELDGDLLFVLSHGRLISDDLAETLCGQTAES